MADDPRIERVARAMCRARGKDPDRMHLGRPEWMHWAMEAEMHIAAFDELRAIERDVEQAMELGATTGRSPGALLDQIQRRRDAEAAAVPPEER